VANSNVTRLLIGIDDTDNLESRGTGYRARQLAGLLTEAGIPAAGVTRHQLLVDPRIPYTSHNSSACIDVACDPFRAPAVVSLCRRFLLEESAVGSDAGLCVAPFDVASTAVAFGARAKTEVLTVDEARALAERQDLHLEGVTGTRIGVIGALAAVGLRAGGSDGRFLWLPALRELAGVFAAADLRSRLSLHRIEDESGKAPGPSERIDLGDRARPLLRGGGALLLVERANRSDCEWTVAPKARIKQLSA
jgi:hypothetical protein